MEVIDGPVGLFEPVVGDTFTVLTAAGGINGEMIALTLYDDGGDPNKARTFATRLVEDDEVQAIIGGTTTGTTMSVVPVVEDAEIPFISLAGAIEIIDPVKEWVFKTPHTDRMACQKIFEDMKAQGITKIGMISGTGGFGASMREQCLEVVGDYGIEVLADESYGPTDADMTPQLTNIKNTAGIEAVLNADFGQGPSVVTRNYQQLAVGLPLYQSHGVASKGFIDLAGAEATEGVRLPGTALLVGDLLAGDGLAVAVEVAQHGRPSLHRRVPGGLWRGALDLRRLRPRRLRDPRRRARPRRLDRPRGHPRRHRADLGPRGHHRRRHHDARGSPRLRPLGFPDARDPERQLDPGPVVPPGARARSSGRPHPLAGARRRWPNSCNSYCPA